MKDLTLTKTERFLLNEVDSVPDKVVRWSMLRTCARQLSGVGFSRVMDRLLRRNLLARDDNTVALTFAGMQALRAA
jgi:hypothetical protein